MLRQNTRGFAIALPPVEIYEERLMKAFPIFLAGLLLVVLVALLPGLPLPESARPLLGMVALVLSAVVFLALITQCFKGETDDTASKAGGDAKVPAEPAPPFTPPSGATSQAEGSAQAEVIAFLGMMQEKGRLVDFLMDDISGYGDEDIGQAARVVYEGCRSVLLEHLTIEPLHDGEEGSRVTVPEGYRATDFQLSGKLTGSAPFVGTLAHRGWKVTQAKLPKVVVADDPELPNLAPAHVEI